MQMKMNSGVDRTKILIIVNAVIVLALLGGLGLYYKKYTDLKKDPNQVASAETEKLVDKVAKVYSGLPSDEKPTVATVQDKEKLKDQPFFNKAENGDKLLIYGTARQAIIFRESTNTIINVGPIAIDNQGQGTTVVKVTGDNIDDKIKILTDANIKTDGTKENNKGNYAKPQIYVADPSQDALANNIAGLLGGEVVKALPAGEAAVSGVAIVVYVN